jgi:hypothetical protein
VADDLGLGEMGPALQEAEESPILTLVDGERLWFQHPLQAQVLERSLPSSRRRHWHAAYARCGEASLASGSPLTFDLAVTLTGHHDHAGHWREAYEWSLRSWDLAGDARGSSEMLHLMRRAVELRGGLRGAAESVTDLLWRLRETAEAVGADGDELAAVDALLEVTDRVAEPLVASELLVRWMRLPGAWVRARLRASSSSRAERTGGLGSKRQGAAGIWPEGYGRTVGPARTDHPGARDSRLPRRWVDLCRDRQHARDQ